MKLNIETTITTVYVVVDTLCKQFLTTPAQKRKMSDAEVITIAVCSALFFNSNHEKGLTWLHAAGYFPNILTASRFNRRLHRLKDFMEFCFESISELFLNGELYIADSMPSPVCKRARASRNRKVKGREYYGYCVAKKENFFGFRLHMIVDKQGIPVSIELLPAAYHDLTPLYEITFPLKHNSTVIGDKAYNCKDIETALDNFGITLMPKRRKNMKHQWPLHQQRFIIQPHRRRIETSFSILEQVMGIERLKVTTLSGHFIKTYAAVLALIFYLTAG